MRHAIALLLATLMICAGCGSADSSKRRPMRAPTADPAASIAPAPDAGELTLKSGASLNYRCTGEGEPAILIEAGSDSAGTSSFGEAFIGPLTDATRVCTYDRLGTGSSDAGPDRSRTLDDLCDVQDEVRDALHLGGPTVLAGQSAGANVSIWCASRNPATVAALVSIEGYHDDPAKLATEGFNWRDNPERVDAVKSSRMLDTMKRPIGQFPVLVVSASNADPGGAENQKYWLGLSGRSRQVVINGGHDLHVEAPGTVVTEILKDLPGQ